EETAVREAIKRFYEAFDEGFSAPADYATEDWHHVNPFGGLDASRAATLNTVREVHRAFLRGVTDTVQEMSIRFATPDVAVGTVISLMSGYVGPDGLAREAGRFIRTFVVVKREERWLIMQDHNTAIASQRG
ncbi:MAG: hypothetical protein JWQ89_4485, partial [Devosia sp.]|uniref:nuclear transport factor 2 family protein n=1 Tax=Devosia sp. TaxID=1871048 RepID=UPI002635A27E